MNVKLLTEHHLELNLNLKGGHTLLEITFYGSYIFASHVSHRKEMIAIMIMCFLLCAINTTDFAKRDKKTQISMCIHAV